MEAEQARLHAELRERIMALDVQGAKELAARILAEGGDPATLINGVIKPAADEIGAKFQREEFFLPQLVLAGNALEAAMNVVLEASPGAGGGAKRSVLIGTVQGDVHTIGKNVVAMMLRTGGFVVHDIGEDVDTTTFLREAIDRDVDIIAMSSLLTTTLPRQREVIEALVQRGVRDRFKVLVGGGPVTADWAREIGADGYGNDASEGLAVARRLLEGGGSG